MPRKAPKNCFWRGNTLWGRVKIKGRLIRWSLRTSDAAVAKERAKAERERAIAAAHYGDDRKTWEDAVVAWTDHITASAGPNTVVRYGCSLRQVEKHLVGCYLDEINKRLVASIVRERRRTGVTNATIRRDLTALSSVLSFCEDEDWIEGNAALARLRKLKERRDPIVLPDHAHIAAVIERAPGALARLTEAALKTGCRQDELVSLIRARLDFARRQVTVIGKGNKLRTIDMLDAYDAFRSVPVSLRGRHVFWHGDGEPYRNVASRFAAIVRETQKGAQAEDREFRRFRFHDLRHRFAVDYLKNGLGGLYDLQLHLGHESIKTTEIYLKYLTPEEALRAKRGGSQKGSPVQRFGDAG